MYLDEFREYCLSKKGVTEGLPFGPDTLVFKVMGKMFALTGLNSDVFTANLKCDPERALRLRESFEEVQPGYHMNKQHWNTVNFDGALEEKLLLELIDHSYDLVAASLSRKLKEELDAL
ncbi:MAG: MmcQ/YjbR family DNA-binding protein [Saprospiraceae bacterium]|nr:MmcQ/YjbR family DNA-binding protein [Saprospiraceae bacterium]